MKEASPERIVEISLVHVDVESLWPMSMWPARMESVGTHQIYLIYEWIHRTKISNFRDD